MTNDNLNRPDPQFQGRHPYNQSRYDRILCKCANFEPIRMTILGNKPVMTQGMSLVVFVFFAI
jgi:hypothetical protein